MRGKIAKQLRRLAKHADVPKETTYIRMRRDNSIRVGRCLRLVYLMLKNPTRLESRAVRKKSIIPQAVPA